MKHKRTTPHRLFAGLFLFGAGLWAVSLVAGLVLNVVQWAGWEARAEEPVSQQTSGVILEVRGPIGPAVSDYFVTELGKASLSGAALVIIEMDTPGGLDTSMREMIQAILASPVPVVTFVSPSGSRAASAGLYILVASHVAAMAPGTNTGAATPIQIGGAPPSLPKPDDEAEETDDKDDEDQKDTGYSDDVSSDETSSGGTSSDRAPEPAEDRVPALGNEDALRAKVINDAAAYIISLAEMRGRNVNWVERAVREAASLAAGEALELDVVDLVATDVTDLLAQLDGREVTMSTGEIRVLSTKGLVLERVPPGWLTRFLAFISNPNVAFIFMSIGTTGIIIEMWNPGSIFPGTLGVVSLIIGLYSFQVLPVNWAGAALVGIGIVLVVAEAWTPSGGLLGFFGLILFVGGSLLMFPSDTPGFELSRVVIFSVAGVLAVFLGLILYAIGETRHRGLTVGAEAMTGRPCVVAEWDGGEGWVTLDGERWKARSEMPHGAGDQARVRGVEGLVLVI